MKMPGRDGTGPIGSGPIGFRGRSNGRCASPDNSSITAFGREFRRNRRGCPDRSHNDRQKYAEMTLESEDGISKEISQIQDTISSLRSTIIELERKLQVEKPATNPTEENK